MILYISAAYVVLRETTPEAACVRGDIPVLASIEIRRNRDRADVVR
jgi:hypothetical protein